jgi:3-ketosteroid 9alpha-monooxygenase subunit B
VINETDQACSLVLDIPPDLADIFGDVLTGAPDAAALRELARPYAGYDAYVCGPDPYMAAARQALADLGVPGKRVHVEPFLSLAENPFEAT